MTGTPDPYVMYLVVRTSLKMNAGKTASQVGHAVMMLMLEWHGQMGETFIPPKEREKREEREQWYERQVVMGHWLKDNHPSYPKIVLAASDDEFMKVQLENGGFLVVDNTLKTETVFGLWPCKKSEASETIKTLKPLR
jgi:peptidyl-tRNA hydrolase